MAHPTTPAMTRDEVLALPAVVGVHEARLALGLSKRDAYAQAADGTLPGLLPVVGRRYRVASSALIDVLGLDRSHTGDTSVIDNGARGHDTRPDQRLSA